MGIFKICEKTLVVSSNKKSQCQAFAVEDGFNTKVLNLRMSTKHIDNAKNLMTEEEIHDFGIQTIVKQLQNEGHEIVSIEPSIKKSPQIIAKIDGKLAFITVRTAPYPGNGQPPSEFVKEKLLEFAAKHSATAFFASVGIANSAGVDAGDERLSAMPARGSGFYVNYRGLQRLETLKPGVSGAKVPIGDTIPHDVDQNSFLGAATNLAKDLGMLDDLPEELANSVANVYYDFWQHYLRLVPMKSGAPFPSEMPTNVDNLLESMLKVARNGTAIIANYKFASDFVKGIRDIRAKHPDQPEIYDYMVQLTLDNLKYGIENADKKSPIRRNIERRFKTPRDRVGLYSRMRGFISLSLPPENEGKT